MSRAIMAICMAVAALATIVNILLTLSAASRKRKREFIRRAGKEAVDAAHSGNIKKVRDFFEKWR